MARSPTAASGAVWGWLIAALLALPVAAESARIVNADGDLVAIGGYDAVAYFTESRAVQGDPDLAHVWQDAKWLFATAEHRDMFADQPERYAPRFGGFCTGGMALGQIREPDPENWSIIEGQLYLNHTKRGRDELRAKPGPIIADAATHWRELGQRLDLPPRALGIER